MSYEQELETTTTKVLSSVKYHQIWQLKVISYYCLLSQMVPGTEWERVAKLCDFNPKTAKNTKDVGRMRSVILQLKQEGTSPAIPKGV